MNQGKNVSTFGDNFDCWINENLLNYICEYLFRRNLKLSRWAGLLAWETSLPLGIDRHNSEWIFDSFSPKVGIPFLDLELDFGLANPINKLNFFSFWRSKLVNVNKSFFSEMLWLLGEKNNFVYCLFDKVRQVVRLGDSII